MTRPTNTPDTALTSTHSAAVVEYLHGHGVAFDVVEHPPTTSAAAEAKATGRAPEAVAKTIVLQDGPAYALAILPASERLDVRKVRDLLTAGKDLRFATEEEIARDFPGLEVGAVPPVGPMLPMAEVIDRHLLSHARILCAGGDHRHSIVLDPQDLLRLTSATVGDICAED
jgi:Ala-tRNA(Pro) deacylase